MMSKSIFFIASLAGALLWLTLTHTAPQTEPPPVPLGLPAVPWPADNGYSADKASLGRLLFFDARLSADGTVSCASCHQRGCGYSDCRAIAIGIDGRRGTRHSPTLINSAYGASFFWDGRAATLEEQCRGPVANPNEMAALPDPHEAHRQCAERVRTIAGYGPLFAAAFGSHDVTMERIAQAVATYERTILSGDAPYDRFRAGDRSALSVRQQQGWRLFKQKGCANCHADYNFTDERFHNIGIGMTAPQPDVGRYALTGKERDWGAFKTPTLREAARTAPYMHDGSLKTLADVVDYYDRGGIANKNLHPLMRPLQLTAEEKAALVSFLEALCGEGWQRLTPPDSLPQ